MAKCLNKMPWRCPDCRRKTVLRYESTLFGGVHYDCRGKCTRPHLRKRHYFSSVYYFMREHRVDLPGIDYSQAALTAVHEAGHVVMCVREHRGFEHVLIYGDDRGWCSVRPLRAQVSARETRMDLYVSLAGLAAEQLALGLPANVLLPACQLDLLDALSRFWNSDYTDVPDICHVLEKVRTGLEESWGDVQAVAGALLEKGRLSATDVRRMVGR